ncbi:mannitol 1-phosphate dehydrogenase [Glonium stellatum]|uniref:Mannitol 1-phosphate dehydrogenase n=1 Tax=Glonium stellatum TaxID=574774 RepID=A0A8E2JV02_9PEZI|nr:mannitol 1-phosphate dehydrogenase [Glonium stellatum]
MSKPTKPYDIAIVGGGIAGLTLAIGLLHKSIRVTIYEAAARFGEIGAGVAFGPNAVRAMVLIDPKIKEGFDRRATVNQSESKEDIWFDFRIGDVRLSKAQARKAEGKPLDNGENDGDVRTNREEDGQRQAGEWVYELPCPPGRGGVHRAHYLEEMVKLLPESVSRFGKRLVDISAAEDGNGDVVLHFADGTTAQHSAVIGCDGIKSRTREILLGEEDPAAHAVFTGKYAYRGLIPMDKAVEALGEELAQNSQLYMGFHGHVLTFPIEKGKTMNVVAFNSRPTWDSDAWVVHATKEEMLTDFCDWDTQVRTIISLMQKPDVWALFDHPPAKSYFKGRVCLLGDAAHASTPHQGSGAGMAVEDAYILSSLLAEANSLEQLDEAFQAYDAIRRPRTQKLVTTSREAGMLYECELTGDDLVKLQQNLATRMNWIWNEDLERELEEAKMLMHGHRTAQIRVEI